MKPGRFEIYAADRKTVKDLQHSRDLHEVCSSLGICNEYRRFFHTFTNIATPLRRLLMKDMPNKLNLFREASSAAFDGPIKTISSPPVLPLPQHNLHFSWTLVPEIAKWVQPYFNRTRMEEKIRRVLVTFPRCSQEELLHFREEMPRSGMDPPNISSIHTNGYLHCTCRS